MATEPIGNLQRVERRKDMLTMDDVLTKLDTLLHNHDELLASHERVNTALFAKDDNNEFGCAGVMTVMQKIDHHIDAMCNFASWGRKMLRFGFWFITGLAGTVAAMKAAGWW